MMTQVYSGGFPAFKVTIESRVAFDTEARAQELLAYLLAHPQFAPDYFGAYEPLRRLTPRRMPEAIATVMNRAGQQADPARVVALTLFQRTPFPRCTYDVRWDRLPHVAFSASFYKVEQDYVRDAQQCDAWLTFVFGLLRLHDAWYASFAVAEEKAARHELTWRIRHPRRPEGVERRRALGVFLERGIPGVYWGNYFGPFYVAWFGRERFASLPCVEQRWLETGGVFFTTAPTPFDWDTPEAHQVQQAVKAHLGADAFFDLATVQQWTRALEPLPESLDPERLQPPRRVPAFPFTVEAPRYASLEEEIAAARQYFTGQGYAEMGVARRTITFRDARGGILEVTVGPGGAVSYHPPG